jgi:hypothetical protein
MPRTSGVVLRMLPDAAAGQAGVAAGQDGPVADHARTVTPGRA